jgi:hypothetical protein
MMELNIPNCLMWPGPRNAPEPLAALPQPWDTKVYCYDFRLSRVPNKTAVQQDNRTAV